MVAMAPFQARILALTHRPVLSPNRSHRDDYTTMMAHAQDLLNDSRIRFVFVHLPVPHPPGIYNRHSHTMNGQGTYLDNLVLADQSLGALRDVIQSTPAAANTTLIVSSDHSWRTFWWKGSGAWSEEAMRATHGGQFDPRPVLMVQLPGSETGQVIAKPVNVLVIHRILQRLLRSQIHNAADINKLVAREPQDMENAQNGN
jgi:hypothetical protein